VRWRRLVDARGGVRSLLILELADRRLGLVHGVALRLTTTRHARLLEPRGWLWLTRLCLPSPGRGDATSGTTPKIAGGFRWAPGILTVMTGCRWLLTASYAVSTVTPSRSTLGSSSCSGAIAESSLGAVGWIVNEI
jgi:hypothetical protein